jgi:CheY-like chemotaxis protein
MTGTASGTTHYEPAEALRLAGASTSPDQEHPEVDLHQHSQVAAKFRLLLVEDNLADAYLVRESIRLHELPLEIQIVEDGAEAISLFDRIEADPKLACPEAVLLDLNLPKRPGVDVLRRIRQSRRCSWIPIIVITSSDSAKDREATASLGADHYFRKPSTYDEFMKLGVLLRRIVDENLNPRS